MKLNRLIVWVLLALMIVLVVSGYGLTKPNLIRDLTGGLINHRIATQLHYLLDLPLMVFLLVHVTIEVRFSFIRWGFRNKKLLNMLVLILGLTSLLLVVYVDVLAP